MMRMRLFLSSHTLSWCDVSESKTKQSLNMCESVVAVINNHVVVPKVVMTCWFTVLDYIISVAKTL